MNNYNKYKYMIAVIPATIFWLVSIVFFVIGLSLDDTTGYMKWIAFALAIANTMIQIIGNDPDEELGPVMKTGWYFSYALGIGSNVYTLVTLLLNMNNVYVEWVVAISLGSMIEILPEPLLVKFIKSLNPDWTLTGNNKRFNNQTNQQREARVEDPEDTEPIIKPVKNSSQIPVHLQLAYQKYKLHGSPQVTQKKQDHGVNPTNFSMIDRLSMSQPIRKQMSKDT